MGPETDPSAVVDPQLRVKGIKGVRAVDAYFFSNIVTGSIYATVVMIGEKVADMIRGIDSVRSFRDKVQ